MIKIEDKEIVAILHALHELESRVENIERVLELSKMEKLTNMRGQPVSHVDQPGRLRYAIKPVLEQNRYSLDELYKQGAV